MDTRIPHFDGQKDFLAFLRFLDDRKVFEGYIKQLDTKIAAFVKATKVYGKAKDIEKLYEEAELWAKRAEHDYAEREKTLIAGEEALAKETWDRRATMNSREADIEQVLVAAKRDQASRDEALKTRESEVGERENAILAREKRAEKAQETAQDAKQAADAMVARVQKAAVA